MENPGIALEIGADYGSAIASKNHKAALSIFPDVIKIHLTENEVDLGKFVKIRT